MKKTFPFSVFFIIIIASCSKDSSYGNNSNTSNNEPSNINLIWENGRSYETTIEVGQTITWTWGSGRHNLRTTSGVESFDSGYSSDRGFQFSHTFSEVGTTSYVCDPHSSDMFGTVTVTE